MAKKLAHQQFFKTNYVSINSFLQVKLVVLRRSKAEKKHINRQYVICVPHPTTQRSCSFVLLYLKTKGKFLHYNLTINSKR